MILVLVGRQGSGKSVVQDELIENYGYEKLITCTTRDPREGESPNAYHFMTDAEFRRRVENGEFVEWDVYRNKKYGTLKASLEADGKLVNVMTPEGAQAVKKLFPDAFVAHINPDMRTAVLRAVSREKELTPGKLDTICKQAMLDYYLYNNVQSDFEDENLGKVEGTAYRIAEAHKKYWEQEQMRKQFSGLMKETADTLRECADDLRAYNGTIKPKGDKDNV